MPRWYILLCLCLCLPISTAHDSDSWVGGAGIVHNRNEAQIRISRRSVASNVTGTFTVNPTQIQNQGKANLTWSFSNLLPGTSFVAVYCPHTASDDDFFDHFVVNNSVAATRTVGPLVNMRCNFQFRLFYNESVKLAKSEILSFVNGPNEPLQGHLSLTNKESEMRVMWISGAQSYSSVQYKLTDGSAQIEVNGTSTTYKASDLCHAPATTISAKFFRDPGFIHDVLLTNLQPRTQYQYRFGGGSHWSAWHTFTSAPKAGNASDQVHLFVFGDMGEYRPPSGAPLGGRGYTTMELIEKDLKAGDVFYELFFVIGDISYADGEAYKWEQTGSLIEPTSLRLPYHVGVGNHEYDHQSKSTNDPSGISTPFKPSWGNYKNDSDGECGVPTFKRFHMPDNGNSLFWYSHDYANAHFTWISTEHDFTPGSRQYKWLENDLASVNRSRTPWLIVLGHRPMYCSGVQRTNGNAKVQIGQRDAYESLLHEHKVDLFMAGHYHVYELTCPVYNGSCMGTLANPRSTVHVVIGTAGANENVKSWPGQDAEWSLKHIDGYGYGRMFIANSTHLRLQLVGNAGGTVLDENWIISDHSWMEAIPSTTGDTVAPTSDAVNVKASVLFLFILLAVARFFA